MRFLIPIVGLFSAALSFPASAENWPSRPVTMVVPFAAGSGTDVIARIFAERLSELLAGQVIVENIGGAGGVNAANHVAKSSPDGYQFLFGTSSTHAVAQTLYKKPLYNAKTDFAPVALIVEQQTVLIARKSLPVANLSDFAAYARTNQAQMQFGSGGVGSATHLACALLNATIGAATTHVPYRAAGLAIQDMIGGRVDYACPLAAIAISQIAGGRVEGLAVLSKKRSPAIPDLATAAEQGFAIDADTWNAFFMPQGTPPEIVQKLNAAVIAAMNTPNVQERLTDMGVTIVTPDRRSPEYLAAFVSSEIDKWAAVVKAARIAQR